MNFLLVFLGSGAGGALRYALSLALNGRGVWPWGTFAANLAGSFLIGAFGALSSRLGWSEQVRLLLTVGLCGGFTTFSTFSGECLGLLRAGAFPSAFGYMAASVLFGIACALAGWAAFR